MLWKVWYSVRDPNYGILLGICRPLNEMGTEKYHLYCDITRKCIGHRDTAYLKISKKAHMLIFQQNMKYFLENPTHNFRLMMIDVNVYFRFSDIYIVHE